MQSVAQRLLEQRFKAILRTKRQFLMIYGHKPLFGAFVRNRHFSSKPITDKASIFIDVSVNGSDFDKCSAR
ncbi:MAG: hypothetical protein ACI31P_04530 [Ligilactobacillus ruminis]